MKKVRPTSWYLQGQTLGRGKCTTYYRHAQQMWPESLVYVCPKCGNAWAKLEIRFEPFNAMRRFCPQHNGGFILPYLLHPHIEIPKEALQHELSMIQRLTHPARYDSALISLGQHL